MGSGLHAFGKFADTEVSLLSDDEEVWELQVEAGRITVAFPISSPEMSRTILEFLQTHLGRTQSRAAKSGEYPGVKEGAPLYSMVAELEISESIALRKDGESPGRFILAICKDDHRVFIDLREGEVEHLIGALSDLWDDWLTSSQP